MITVTVHKNEQGHICSFVVKGHSGLRPRGEDIVCAGVSVLVQTAAYSLRELLHLPVDITVRDGYLSCVLPREMSSEVRQKADLLLDSMLLGLKATKSSHPQYIRIDE